MANTPSAVYRHGDIIIAATNGIPADALPLPTRVLAYGEVTGHSHRLEDPTAAEVMEFKGVRYVRVTAESVRLVHEEHGPITLPRGFYRFWHQREYTPGAIRRVVD
jgi:hypothetical protein